MKVSDLAAELGVAPSTVLEQCQRFGIEAGWAGAELVGADVVVLRAELAGHDAPLDLRPTDPALPDGAPDAGGGAGTVGAATTDPDGAGGPPPLPPTSAASMPDVAGEVAGEVAGDAVGDTAPEVGPGGIRTATLATDADRAVPTTTFERPGKGLRGPQERRLDRSARASAWAAGIAVLALAVAEVVGSVVAIFALWLLAAIAVVSALWAANRGRRHVQTHPERTKGLGLAVAAGVVALGCAAVLGLSIAAVVGDDPAAEATLGDRSSIETARWGYQRLVRLEDNGWKRPAKDAGTCWVVDVERVRDVERLEVGTERVDCESAHTIEIVKVYSFDQDADSSFPGNDALQADATERCGDLVAELLREGSDDAIDGVLIAEHPTEEGWSQADRDIACAVVTSSRNAPLEGA